MPEARKKFIRGAVFAVICTVICELIAWQVISNIAYIAAPLDESGILFSRLINLRSAIFTPAPLFTIIFSLLAAMSVYSDGMKKSLRIILTVIFIILALTAAIWDMKVNSVPFGTFVSIVVRYIKGGMLDAL